MADDKPLIPQSIGDLLYDEAIKDLFDRPSEFWPPMTTAKLDALDHLSRISPATLIIMNVPHLIAEVRRLNEELAFKNRTIELLQKRLTESDQQKSA